MKRQTKAHDAMSNKPERKQVVTRRAGLIAIKLIMGAAFIVVALLVIAAFVLGQTGFEKKTLWDWMDLALVPAVLASLIWWLNRSEQIRQERIMRERAETEHALSLDRMHEERLQAYLGQMIDLLEKGLNRPESDIKTQFDAAQVRTLTALRGLDGERKGLVLQFLYASDLIKRNNRVIFLMDADLSEVRLHGALLVEVDLSGSDLRKADLSEAWLLRADLNTANLSGADLRETALSGADLTFADLSNAKLINADLSEATMIRANLSEANLSDANMCNAGLSEANLSRANLSGADLGNAYLNGANLGKADLSNATISSEQLAQVKSLKGATMPDGTKHE